ncbi:hypothetical protein D3C87_1241910 [compost metagenome]
MPKTKEATAMPITFQRFFSDHSRTLRYGLASGKECSASALMPPLPFETLRKRAEIIGVMVRATRREKRTANATVRPNSLKN